MVSDDKEISNDNVECIILRNNKNYTNIAF